MMRRWYPSRVLINFWFVDGITKAKKVALLHPRRVQVGCIITFLHLGWPRGVDAIIRPTDVLSYRLALQMKRRKAS